MAPMGEIIGLDHGAVLNVIKLCANGDTKKMFEDVLICYRVEQDFSKADE